MHQGGLVGVHRRRGVRTTRRGPEEHPAADLVQRDFTATAPNQLWVTDITYGPTWAGFLYLAIVLALRNFDGLVGKRVGIRGLIKLYKGQAEIVIESMEQIVVEP